jgi:hypothetical protein
MIGFLENEVYFAGTMNFGLDFLWKARDGRVKTQLRLK